MKDSRRMMECQLIDKVDCIINSDIGIFKISYKLFSLKSEAEYYLIEISTESENELVAIGSRESEAREIYSMIISGQVTPATLKECVNSIKCQV